MILIVFLGRRIPHHLGQALGELYRLEPNPQVKDLLAQGQSTSSFSCHPLIQDLHQTFLKPEERY